MYVIPAIDMIAGKVVRLTHGDYKTMLIYHNDPLEVAKQFEAAGIQRLHLVDLDGAKSGHIVNHKILEKISRHTTLHVDFGGGIKSTDDARLAFECGAKQITGGTIAVKNRDLFLQWLNIFGTEKIILGADAKNEKIAVQGWTEVSELLLKDFLADYITQGVKYSICTDISKDGALQGTSVALYKNLLEQFPNLKLIASGGVTTIQDLESVKKIGCFGAIVGKAFYEGHISLKEIEKFNLAV